MKLAIAQLRAQQGLTQAQLAEQLGVGEALISKLESGLSGDRILRSIKLTQVLQCPLADLHNMTQVRQRAGLSQGQLAAEAGVSDRTVRAWESGEKQMEGLDLAISLCRVFNVEPLGLVE